MKKEEKGGKLFALVPGFSVGSIMFKVKLTNVFGKVTSPFAY